MRFHFELLPLEEIEPWGEPPKQTLSWFALTDGYFHIDTEAGALGCYSAEALEHFGWGSHSSLAYQVAGMAREVLGAVQAAMAPVPAALEDLVADWPRFSEQKRAAWAEDTDENYSAVRWLGERHVGLGFFDHNPSIYFVRTGNSIRVCWDHRAIVDEGVLIYAEPLMGSLLVPVGEFHAEARRFVDELLRAMESRIDDLESGARSAQIKVSVKDLRSHHKVWNDEFSALLDEPHQPDMPWDEVIGACRA